MNRRMTLTPEKAMVRAEELCARAEHSSGEIMSKLIRWGIAVDEAKEIVASLISRKFVCDRRFAEAFVRDKVNFARWGRRKIALALHNKGIDRNLSNEVLAEIDMDKYVDNLRHIIKLKQRSISDPDSFDGRTRLFRFAASRGFEPDLIAKIIRTSNTGTEIP